VFRAREVAPLSISQKSTISGKGRFVRIHELCTRSRGKRDIAIEMTTEPNIPADPTTSARGIPVETEPFKSLQFYAHNYIMLVFAGLGAANKQIILGRMPFECRFCGGTPPQCTFEKRAHAVSELLGNKIMKSLYECDTCNERFSKFENDLGKMTRSARSIGGVIGKRGVPELEPVTSGATHKPKMIVKGGGVHFSHEAGDIGLVEDENAKTLTLTYVQKPYRPLGAYKALCKSAFTLLPDDELVNFKELQQWLLQPDLTTYQVYSSGSHICYSIFVPAFQPFKQPIVCMLKRRDLIDAPYISFFIATGNVSYQIFLPCPAKDEHLRGKTITTEPFPRFFQLQPWLIPAPTQTGQVDLSSPDRTQERTGKMSWRYESKTKIA
jgi:hypothetical protein